MEVGPLGGLHAIWLHGLVGRLEADASVLAVDALEGGAAIGQEDHRDLSVLDGLAPLHDDQVSVEDGVLDHGVPGHAKGEGGAARQRGRDGDVLVRVRGVFRAGGDSECADREGLTGGDDRELLEDLVRAALGEALRNAKTEIQSNIKDLTNGMPLPPGLF